MRISSAGAFSPAVEGSATPEQLEALLEIDLKTIEEEHHGPLGVLSKTADGLPGFGIVAAVLGIVITMGAIDGPVERDRRKGGRRAGRARFLGILASYGFIGPLVGRLESMGHEELAFFRTISSVVLAFVKNLPPKVAIDQARRGLASNFRPSREELDQLFKQWRARRQTDDETTRETASELLTPFRMAARLRFRALRSALVPETSSEESRHGR